MPGHTEMHYLAHRLHRMQKHKIGVTCPDALFVKSLRVHPSMKNCASMTRADALECTT
jgi:hypothetical protein